MRQRIKLLVKYETIVRWLKKLACFKSTINVFPNTLPDGKIVIKRNKLNKVFIRKKTKPIPETRNGNGVGDLEFQQRSEISSAQNISGHNEQNVFEKLDMDPKIISEVRGVLKNRTAESVTARLRNIESEMKKIADRLTQCFATCSGSRTP